MLRGIVTAMLRSSDDVAQLRALVFCRECRVAEAGVTLVDIHDTRLSATFPASFHELWLYVSFEVSRPGAVDLELQVTLPSQQQETVATSTVTVDDGRVVISPVDLSEFEFPTLGRYRFSLYAAGALLGSSALSIELLPSPLRRGTN